MHRPKDKLVAEAEQLRREIEEDNYNYFRLDTLTIPDAEYDRRCKGRRTLEAEYRDLVTRLTPTALPGSAAELTGRRNC